MKEKEMDLKATAKLVIEKGCSGCFNAENGHRGSSCTIDKCPFLSERDLHDGRITSKEYDSQVS